jgi:glucose/arabinose dehydrogenase
MRGSGGEGWIRALALALLLAAVAPAGADARLPPGFRDRAVHEGLEQPTSLAIAPTGETFVAERRGTIERFDDRHDRTPTPIADLSDEVMTAGDRGMLAIAVDPGYPERPYLYVAYTHDAPIGGTAPFWGEPGVPYESCPPEDPYSHAPANCLVSSRVARITLGADRLAAGESVIAEDWCQVFPSHSIGDLVFDQRKKLLVSGGEGASYVAADAGREGDPPNACGDPPGEGGALRAQDSLTGGDPGGLDGAVARIEPMSGEAAPGNGDAGPGADPRVVAFGLRNPYRFTIRPGTDELWIGDVGWTRREEINRTTIGEPADFGWPCFEGSGRNKSYDELNVPICERLYDDPTEVTAPWFSYSQSRHVAKHDRCEPGASAISGIAFDRSRTWRGRFDGALFFSDEARNCIWTMRPDDEGVPDPGTVRVFESPSRLPVDLIGTRRGLYYASITEGTIRRISYNRRAAHR